MNPGNPGWTIAVGSRNRSKVAAAERVFQRLDSRHVVVPYEAESGVRPQPWGEEETRQGACNRARQAMTLAQGSVWMAVGMEGGLEERPDGLYVISICAVVDYEGKENVAAGASFLLPPAVAAGLRAAGEGAELGPVIDRLAGGSSGQQQGAIGFLTKNLTSRQQNWELALAYALVPWLHPEFYE